MTGAQVMAMAEDVPALKAIKPGGKEHPIDKVLHDGETVTLGGMTLVAHLTPGTRAAAPPGRRRRRRAGRPTTWCSAAACARPATLTPAIVDEFTRSFNVVRTLPCDVQLGDHGAQYNMQAKYAKLQQRRSEPVHRSGQLQGRSGNSEAMFRAILAEQQKDGRP